MTMHAFNLLQAKQLYMFCLYFEPYILVGLQQTTGYHILCIFSLVMLLCSVVYVSAQSFFLVI